MFRRSRWIPCRPTKGNSSIVETYEQLVRKGTLEKNPLQRKMVECCVPLLSMIALSDLTPVTPAAHASKNTTNLQTNVFQLFKTLQEKMNHVLSSSPPTASTDAVGFTYMDAVNIGVVEKRGLYLWGDVGIGKTMVLDLFFACDTKLPKRRAHLHSFMSDITQRLVQADKDLQAMKRVASPQRLQQLKTIRPIDLVVSEVLAESPILCFDEFQTFDVAHAALLSAFFQSAFQRGLFLITTSNRHPSELCKVSASFNQFLPLLDAYCEVVHCGEIRDYRIPSEGEERCHEKVFLHPSHKAVAEKMVKKLERGIRLQGGEVNWIKDDVILHHGRTARVPYHCAGVALFDFEDICGERFDFASVDYQLFAKTFHTIFIANVPQIGTANRNAAHQFIVLVDELYQHRVKLLMTCTVPWSDLMSTRDFATGMESLGSGTESYYSEGEDDRSGYTAKYDFQNEEEVVSFSRIRSRLNEMGSRRYLTSDHTDFVVCDFNFSVLIE